MKKFLIVFIVYLFFSTSLFAEEGFVPADEGIQKNNMTSVPHISKSGKVQYGYNSDSFFSLGLYAVDTGRNSPTWDILGLNDSRSRDTLQEVKDAGFNAIHTASGWPPSSQELNRLNEVGLKIYPHILHWIGQSDTNWLALKNNILTIKDNDAILAYELFDEDPSNWGQYPNLTLSAYTGIRNTIHGIDPGRAIYANEGWDDHSCKFSGVSDISSADYYPINSSTDSLGKILPAIDNFFRDCPGKPVFFIFKAYKVANSTDASFLPTPEQIRGQMYLSIVHGATGLVLFVQHTPWQLNYPSTQSWWDATTGPMFGISPQVNADRWNEAAKVNKEIDRYKQIYLSKTAKDEYHILRNGTGRIHTMLKDTGEPNIRYLLAANIDAGLVSGQFSFPSVGKIKNVLSLLDNRTITPSSETTYQDDFGQYGVRLYKIEFGSKEILNPGFETDNSGWNPNVPQWGEITNTTARSGSHSLHIPKNYSTSAGMYQPYDFLSNTTYRYSVWVKTVNNNVADTIYLQIPKGAKSLDSSVITDIDSTKSYVLGKKIPQGTTDWQKITSVFKTSSEGSGHLFAILSAPSSGDVYFDDVSLEVILNSILGDINGDDKVNIFDYNALVASFGNPYTIFDYNILVGNFGKSL